MSQTSLFQQAAIRHARYYLGQLSQANSLYEKGGQFIPKSFDLLNQIWLQVAHAYEWVSINLSATEALDLANNYPLAGGELLFVRQTYELKVAWANVGLEAARHLGKPIDIIKHLIFLGRCHLLHSNAEMARQYYAEALSLAREQYYPIGEAQALLGISRIDSLRPALFQQVRASYQQALAIFEAHDDTRNVAWTLMNLGNIEERYGDWDAAEIYIRRSMELYQSLHELRGEANCWKRLASIAERRKNYRQSKLYLEEALRLSREADDPLTICQCLEILGLVVSLEDDLLSARQIFEEALTIARKYLYLADEANCYANLSWIANQLGDIAQAKEHQLAALAIHRHLNHPSSVMNGLVVLGLLELKLKEYENGRQHLQEGLRLIIEYGRDDYTLEAVIGYAKWYWIIDDPITAFTLLSYVRGHPAFERSDVATWLDGWEIELERALTPEQKASVDVDLFDYDVWIKTVLPS